MNIPESENSKIQELIFKTILSNGFIRATFAGPQRINLRSNWIRVVVRPITIRRRLHLQFSYFDRRKNIVKNYLPSEAETPLREVIVTHFAGIHISTETGEIDIRISKKGKITVARRGAAKNELTEHAHNRSKNVPLPDGQADRVLEIMGILTPEGRVRSSMRAKYIQINEFLKHLQHSLKELRLQDLQRPIELIDCGCGLSYLTLAAHHYLNDKLKLPTNILGVDINEEVIRKSIERSSQLRVGSLSFSCNPIQSVTITADVVLALHACDTATDAAIAKAVQCNAHLLICVPCCHSYLNDQLRTNHHATILRPMLRHGILRQRTAEMVTDALRALTLQICGYQTEVVEFVATEHTQRNIMLRATKRFPAGNPTFISEYITFKQFWGVTPYLEKLLGEDFRRMVSH